MKSINHSLLKHAILRSAMAVCRSERRDKQNFSEFAEIIFDKPLLQNTDFALLSDKELYDLGISPIPTRLQNALICEKLFKVYGEQLFIAGIFKRENGLILIDVDSRLSRTGFFLPVRNRQKQWYGLMVYRSERDSKPFYLKSRKELLNA